jgi:trypsin
VLSEALPGSGGRVFQFKRKVVTAAHCVNGTSANQLAVAVGRTVLSRDQGQRRGVSAVFVHPEYETPTENAHDVALLRLGLRGHAHRADPTGPADDSLERAGT